MTEQTERSRVAFTCAYTPLPLLEAAGCQPYRLLPLTSAPDEAGTLLHDNMCPHVKRVLNRALADELPPVVGAVFMESCDAMRRLHDAWRSRRAEPAVLVDLPPASDLGDGATRYLAGELARLAEHLAEWSGQAATPARIAAAVERANELALLLEQLEARAAAGALAGGRRALQELRVLAVTAPLAETLARARALDETEPVTPAAGTSPLWLTGNVMPDPEAYALLESCGVRLVGDDVCTGARQLVRWQPIDASAERAEVLLSLAQDLLARPPCARTFATAAPGSWGRRVVEAARAAGARGLIVHVVKFCDPYLIRLPALRQELEEAKLPALFLEGDCTLGSLGQQRTRLEAFVEMLGGGQ